ncbi:NAD-dependent epimerase/dehydratase family protein [Paraflavitalea soli]|uniref:GDP-mannose 4,6-dehydratase n=1 Tax=Paraflavitalea soli TaxID=2315862 RepID=A0A3B7MLS9_9BACT|nr:GDP-mannose 4,6-dehydratase [Paraflavitalea soli]AXY74000.1 NAD-dependent epimerase/dehydratase family protein [Paraflavitalea soli]
MTAIIFGANGQDGYYLSKLLLERGIRVIPVSRQGDVIKADVADFEAVRSILEEHKPDYIFHLAANSTTRHQVLFENHATISTGTLNILEAVRTVVPQAKVFISGSGLQFKNEDLPIKETAPFDARDAYSVSRIHSVYAARYYRSLGIKTYIGYFFNHDSPRRSDRHVCKMIANAVKKIANGEDTVIEIGDMSVKKEWGFAGDIVEAVWTLVQQDEVFEAVLGTGEAFSIKDYIEVCFDIIQKDWTGYVKPVEGFKAEYRQLVSDPATIFSLGWRPSTNFRQLAALMLTTA